MIFVSKILSFTLVGLAGAVLLQAGPDEPAPVEAAGQAGEATGHAVVNFSELAAREAAQPAVAAPRKVIHAPLRPNTAATFAPAAAASAGKTGAGTPGLASPAPVINFLALPDDGTSIPPDTHGAVGPNHVMTVLNTQVRVQNRNGGVLTTVSLDGFWASVGGSPSCFDPKLLYDPYDNRWMFTACADGQATTSALLMGVSQTSDPTGTWFLYRVDGDAANID